jgi:hypothetical protein
MRPRRRPSRALRSPLAQIGRNAPVRNREGARSRTASSGSVAGAGFAAPGSAATGACMASWIDADSSPQKSSARTGGGATISAGAASSASSPAWSSALGPKGTSSSRGPNQSLGKRTTFAVASSSSPPAELYGPSFSTGLQTFFGGSQTERPPSAVVYPLNWHQFVSIRGIWPSNRRTSKTRS